MTSQTIKLDTPISTAEDLESEIKILTNLIRISVIKNKIPEEICTKKCSGGVENYMALETIYEKRRTHFKVYPI